MKNSFYLIILYYNNFLNKCLTVKYIIIKSDLISRKLAKCAFYNCVMFSIIVIF